ncbi:MAG: lysophospholipid acyltransferase family protein [Flavobacteriales bacterium]|nr:lysophospholipid acyltransferase family protein [Flavobacteriales bacterium]MBP9078978.1 lysophospholipid acyltransferase family protein [Flavobacteriales bacterium]
MGALSFYLLLPLIYGISLLPFRVLYVLSDVLESLLFGVFGYRLKVVRENLRNSFPGKSVADLQRIEHEFRRWFCDLMVETIKTLTITPKQVNMRISVEGTEVLQRYYDAGQSVILVMGHWGNWELGGARFSQLPFHKLNVIYHPLQNKHFDRLFIRMRTRLGNGLYPMKDTVRCMVRDRHEVTATAFIADQTPSPEHAYWTTFLHQDTPVFWGTETIARKLDRPVVYLGLDQPRRGHYTMRFELLEADPATTQEGAISERHTRRLEEDIRMRPALWLWTHRRWKHGGREPFTGRIR